MSRQIIDIGVTPNDGTGDPIRTAMIKINDNFEEVYGSWTVTGPLTIASDNSNTTITDKKIEVNLVEIPGNVVINTTGLNVNGSNYISSNGILGSSLLVGQCVKVDGLNIVVNNFVGSNTTITGNSVTACTFAVPNGFTIDSSGIKTGNITAITANSVVTANVTVGNVNINQNNLNVKGAIVGVGYIQAPTITGQDIVANSTVRVGATTITPSAIQTNGLGIGNIAVTVDNISIAGNGPAGGTNLGPAGISTQSLTVNGAIVSESLRAKTLNVDEQVIDKIIADTLQVGQAGNYSYIDGDSVTSYFGIFNTANLYNLSVNNSINIANTTFISPFEISTQSLNSKGPVIAKSLTVNNAINASDAFIGGVTSLTNNGIVTSNMSITSNFQAASASFRDGMDVGNGRIVLNPSGQINADSIIISKSIEIPQGFGNTDDYSISMNADGSFRTGFNKLDFLSLNMGSNNLVISQNSVIIANTLFISNNNMGEILVGNTLVNSSIVIADVIAANVTVSAKAISVGDLTNNTNINSTSIETNLVISNNMSVTNASIGGVSMKANALTVGAARVDANTISITGGAVINASGVTVSANLVTKNIIANNSLGSAGQILFSNGNGVYWGPASGSDPNALQKAQNLADVPDKAAARSNLGLASGATTTVGSAATLNVGIGAGNIVQLDGNAKLPGIDGSQLTNINGAAIKGELPTSSDKIIISSAEPDPAQGGQNWIWFKV